MLKEQNIFSTQEYAKLYQGTNDRLFSFTYQEGQCIFKNLSIKTLIPNTNLYDMTSPYGYSGYFSNSCDYSFLERALNKQREQAIRENIIAEFIRFNPYQNHKVFADFLDFYTLEKYMVEVDTNYHKRWNGYQSRLKGKLRKSLTNLNIRQSYDLEYFFNLYTETMKRNQAQDFYFFPLEYFQQLSKLNGFVMFEALYNGLICAMAIFLINGNRSYYHLGANSPITLANNLNAMGAIFETFFQYAEQKDIVSCLLGGGRTTSIDDTLLKYKKQYSSQLVPFYIGGKVYDYQEYQKLTAKYSNSFFLKYRY